MTDVDAMELAKRRTFDSELIFSVDIIRVYVG